MKFYQDACGQLSMAGETMIKGRSALSQLKETEIENDLNILVPMTSLLYVPGRLALPQQFLVDIGSDTIMEKNSDQSMDFFDRRSQMLKQSFEELNTKLRKRFFQNFIFSCG